MAQALVVEGLTVAFGGVKALDDVSFRADVDIFGVIGPNGAGKSTLLNCLTGFQSYDNGRVRLGDASLAGAACGTSRGTAWPVVSSIPGC